MILGSVLVAVLLLVFARYLYTKFWLERSENYNKCKHCGKHYEDDPFYCPHCGEVVDEGGD
ncbi:MAG: hypothetical protein ABEJ25_06855 [Candidatus Bipolaricaulia bacterium]